jgi:competence protein ComEC
VSIPAVLVAIPLLIGSATAIALADASPELLPVCAAGGALVALLAAAAAFSDGDAAETTVALVAGVALGGLSLGAVAARQAYARVPPEAYAGGEEPVALEGTLEADGALTPFGASLVVGGVRLAAGLPVEGDVRLSVGGAAAAAHADGWRAGRRVRVFATLRSPTTYRNFGVAEEGRAQARRGVSLVGSVKSASLVEIVQRGARLAEAAAATRAWCRRQVDRHVGTWSGRSAAIVSAILIGDRTGLSEEDERRLQEAGTYHVIAISGGNIAILTALILFALRAARVPPRASAALAIAALLFYSEITGAPASVARAVTAAVVFLAARLLDHRGPALNALAVAAVCAVALTPMAAVDPGFILSFGATAGILLGVPRAMAWLRPSHARRPPLLRAGATAIAGLLAATICAEIALAPVGAALFSRITFAGLVLNFAAIPLMTVVQAASLTMLAVAPVEPHAARLAGYVAHAASAGLVESSRLIDVAAWLSQDVSPPAWWVMATYYAACGTLLFVSRARRAALVVVAIAGVVMVLSPGAATRHAPPAAPGRLRVAFLDVGQGDATLVRLPHGGAMLIDAAGLPGSVFDIGQRVVAPAVRAFGVRRLDTLVLTHADPDHVGGAAAVLRRFRPRAIWEGVPVPPHPGLRALAASASANGTTWRTVRAGDTERAADVDIRVVHPPAPDWERQRVRNDDSVVVELRMGDVSIVLPGDVGREGERALLSRLSAGRTVILKAPHHGSGGSSTPELLAALRPAAVIFSAGRRNPFGHPAPVVLSRYRGIGAEIFRTDEDGAVIVDTNGTTVWIRTHEGRHVTLPR